jgi:hypothetical protein
MKQTFRLYILAKKSERVKDFAKTNKAIHYLNRLFLICEKQTSDLTIHPVQSWGRESDPRPIHYAACSTLSFTGAARSVVDMPVARATDEIRLSGHRVWL